MSLFMHRTMCRVIAFVFSSCSCPWGKNLLQSCRCCSPGGSGATLRWLKLSEERDIDLLAEMPERLKYKLREADSVSMQ